MPEEREKRQFVNFAFYKISNKFRSISVSARNEIKKSALECIEEFKKKGILVVYSTLGFRADVDFLLWRISYNLDDFQDMDAMLNHSMIGSYLHRAASYLAMTKRSIYIDKHQHEGQDGNRLAIYPGKAKYLFVYPFVKTREWYLLPKEKRQEFMNEHIRIGNLFPSVKLNTTYSFGLDDQEFVVAFETDFPSDFLDLVMALRETETSKFTLRDTPIYTCKKMELADALNLLG
jgi:chlorite dismutase